MIPVLGALALAATSLMVHLLHMQPTSLQPWLERDRHQGLSTVLLYREARAVQAKIGNLRDTAATKWSVLIGIGAAAIIALLLTSLLASADVIDERVAWLCFLGMSALFGLPQLRRMSAQRSNAVEYGFMGLVAEYRTFAQTIVRRLKEGAVGHASSDARVVVAIDELDKMEVDQLRLFVRRLKAVFEVPGVYYYVSLSEDALARLYLGVGGGKDEFDSSFDHVLQVPALSTASAAVTAAEFLEAMQVDSAESRLPSLVAALSLGVPRDILRRADELRSWKATTGRGYVSHVRRRHAELGYRTRMVSRTEAQELEGDPKRAAQAAAAILRRLSVPSVASSPPVDGDTPAMRFVLLAWVYAELELAYTEATDDESWLEQAEQLRALGYRIAVDPPADVVSDMSASHDRTLRKAG